MTLRRWLFGTMGVLLLVTAGSILQGCSQEEESAKAPQGPTAATETVSVVSGEVVSVNPQANELEVQDATGKKWVVGVEPTTAISEDGKTFPFADLTPGTRVEVQLKAGPGEQSIAQAIAIKK